MNAPRTPPRLAHAAQIVLLAVAMACAPAPTTHATEPAAAEGSPPPVALNLENADITELVRWVAKLTGRNIIVHPSVKGEVTLIAGEPLTPDEAYRVFLSVLQVHGLGVIDTGAAIKVVPAEDLNREASAPDPERAGGRFADDVIVRVVKVRNVPAAELVTVIKPLASPGAVLTAYPDSNLLLMSDRKADIDRLLALVARLDQETTLDVEVLRLRHANAPELYATLQTLLPAERKLPHAFHLVADKRSNSLLLSGDPAARAPLRALIARLDIPLAGAQDGNTHVVYLDYADATSLLPILQTLGTSAVRSGLDATFTELDFKIDAHADTNALVITAPKPVLDSLRSVITALDVRRPQVVVEAIIVEVNRDGLRDLGVKWVSEVPSDGVFGAIGLLPPLPTPDPPDFGQGLTVGANEDGTLRALLRALESNANANLLSTPTVVALDNEEAEILVGENVPFITGSSTGAASTTNNPFQTIERHDVGVTLKVKSRINRDDSITLSIVQTVEAVTDSAAETADIVTSKRSIATKVLIDDNELLVLGGLIRDDVTEKINKVPLLGSIPLIGRAFRSTSTQNVKKNLMVFIHPRILRSRSDNALETRQRYDRMRALQSDLNTQIDRFLIPLTPLPSLPAGDAGPAEPRTRPE